MTDSSVLIESGDPDDAENVGAVLGHPALSDYVHPEEQFTVTSTDPVNDEFSLSNGKAFIGYNGGLDTSDGFERRQLMFAVEKTAETGISLDTVSGDNYVYLDAQIGTPDSPQWVVQSSQTPPSEESLLIATIRADDPDTDSTSERLFVQEYHNRAPDTVASSLTHPDDADISVDGSRFIGVGLGDDTLPPSTTRDLVRLDSAQDSELQTILNTPSFTSTVSLQTGTVFTGTQAVEVDIAGGEDGSTYTWSSSDFPTTFRPSDTLTFYTQYSNDSVRTGLFFGVSQRIASGATFNTLGYKFTLDASAEEIILERDPNASPLAWSETESVTDLSAMDGEWFEVEIEWSTDHQFTVTVTRTSTGTVVGSLSVDESTYVPDSTKWHSAGAVFATARATADTAPFIYYDGYDVERLDHVDEDAVDDGYRTVGKNVRPKGPIHTGPHEQAVGEHSAGVHGVVTNSPVSGPTEQRLRQWMIGGLSGSTLRWDTNADTAPYAVRDRTSLDRIPSLTANLSWEYDAFSDVPGWISHDDGGDASWTYEVTGLPRRLQATTDGSNTTNTEYGGVIATPIISPASIGSFRLTFKDVQYSQADFANSGLFGLTTQLPDVDPRTNGDGIIQEFDGQTSLVDGGTQSTVGTSITPDDLSIEYDQDAGEVRILDDGVVQETAAYSVTAAFRPVLAVESASSVSTAETISAGQLIVEELQ
jgi:hypothetical protein